jgi:penicillin-binding protein 1B
MRRIVRFILVCSIPFALGGVYIATLYHQLEESFLTRQDFIPTRIFSDVTRIAPGAPRSWVEQRLKALGYNPGVSGEKISFALHPMRYPETLLPEEHPTLEAAAQGRSIELEFDGTEPSAELVTVRSGESEIPEVFLEPELVGSLGFGDKKQVREWVPLADIPPTIWQAILAIEDQHFLDHIGLDWRGLARAIFVNLKQLRFAQGGSTLTQQLVKNLMERHDKNLVRKVNEAFLTLLLELRYSKEEILERYLNEVYLGQIGVLEVHGVSEGAKYFFGKRLAELELHEAALMAALIRGPGYYSPYRYMERALERQKLVLRKMVETGHIAEEEMLEASRQKIRLAPAQSASNNKAPFFVDFVKAEILRKLEDRFTEQELPQAGLRVYTTLLPHINAAAQRAVADGVGTQEKNLEAAKQKAMAQAARRKKTAPSPGPSGSPEPELRLEGALAAVEHRTGFIRALVGGRNYAQSSFNRILNMKRQVGSTFKPVVFLAALQKGKDSEGVPFTPAYPVEDAPFSLTYDRSQPKWTPKNYEPDYEGWVTMRRALAHSINTASARIAQQVGIREIINTARALGIEGDLPEVPSITLGTPELSPVELLKIYASLANHGQSDELTVLRAITLDDGTSVARFIHNPQWVADPAPVDALIDLMTTVFEDGTASPSRNWGWNRPSAGKTGTTSAHRDSWFAGFTPQLTTVVWVGWDHVPTEVQALPKLTGATAALPIWVNFMKEAHRGEPVEPFAASPHLIEAQIDRKSGLRASGDCPLEQVLTERVMQSIEFEDEACAQEYPESIREVKAN